MDAKADARVRLSCVGAVATVVIERERKLNTLTPDMLEQLEACADSIERNPMIRSVVLTGDGQRAFCAGADINEWSSLPPLEMWRSWVRIGHRVFDRWARLRMPVIAALNGHALGGGLELAVTADVRICSSQALLGLPEASIATCPGWSGTQRLVRLVGPAHAKYMALAGQRIAASAALGWGLVDEVVEPGQVQDRAHELARQMAANAPVALQLTKQLINAASQEDASASMEAMAGALAATTQDAAEGMRAFREKRPPKYEGH
ncbi:enoyl-CoA hydratase/isomerase family protein [Piscinibacter terrae]|uniref:Enoyl-CoA hydratase/isomerase family protein n=1 Tax=Piscinibacter terrae TaxID=2496871 RepID=A0A3N7HL72_9BURK|nr:enoyl-CoA hydratase-related protein [Albitalea terrae]RQP21766.1 enoyl-CoA hydratase/isomerase family protein [Albitalea terrae]